VFKALTDPDELSEWLAESAEVDLDDGRYEFWGRYAPKGDQARQKLLETVPDERLRFSWDLVGAGEPSIVDIAIAPGEAGASVVTVAHTGVPAEGLPAETLDCFWHVSLANLAAQSEGRPTMPPFDFSAPAQGDALVRTVIDVAPEEVFASLLDPADVNRWAKGTAVIEPRLGGRYDFGWDHGPAEITEFEQDKTLAYTWRYPDSPDTMVRWTLRFSRGSTYLTLTHSGFADDALAEQFRQGWPAFLVELKRILELGSAWEPLKI
jgi:uncharacterized protein YndB with AHSA1/START domain